MIKSFYKQRVSGLRTVIFWAAGLALIWWLVPVGPRDRWQPPANELVCGFLQDERTVVTADRTIQGPLHDVPVVTGPIRLWDLETGQLRASHFGPSDFFDEVAVLPGADQLKLQHRTKDKPKELSLRMCDAWTGKEIANFASMESEFPTQWHFAADGRTTVFLSFDRPSVAPSDSANGSPPFHRYVINANLYDVATVRPLFRLETSSYSGCLSADGTRFAVTEFLTAASSPGSQPISQPIINVWDVPTGEVLTSLPYPFPLYRVDQAKEFSRDNELLLDHFGRILEVATGKVRFQVPYKCRSGQHFSPDGRSVIAVTVTPAATESRLSFFDLATGQEEVERQLVLFPDSSDVAQIDRATADGRLVYANTAINKKPPKWCQWLSKLPGLEHLGQSQQVAEFVLVDVVAGREVMRGKGHALQCSPRGCYLLIEKRDRSQEIWDVPARKPVRQLFAWDAGWSALLGLMIWRRSRRTQRPAGVAPAA